LKEIEKFWLKKANEAIRSKYFEEAQEFLRKFKEIENSKQEKDFWYKNGLAHMELEEYNEAIECFNKDLKINNDHKSFFQKGIALCNLRKFREAIECFNNARQSKYSSFLKTTNYIEELKAEKQFETAVIHLTELDKEKSLPYEFWYFRGFALNEIGKHDEAVDCINKALEMQPEKSEILLEKARTELFLGRKDICMNFLKKTCMTDINMLEKILKDETFTSHMKTYEK